MRFFKGRAKDEEVKGGRETVRRAERERGRQPREKGGNQEAKEGKGRE